MLARILAAVETLFSRLRRTLLCSARTPAANSAPKISVTPSPFVAGSKVPAIMAGLCLSTFEIATALLRLWSDPKVARKWSIELVGFQTSRASKSSVKSPRDWKEKRTTNSPLAQIELRAEQVELLNACENPPFIPGQQELPGEDMRLRYRYIDLRRAAMQRSLVLRSKIVKIMRDYFAEHNFIDVETPILGRSTPEGARDYLVPSRVHPGKFYALPQSPQLYKQILMVAGFDRYVQVAKCFRDEDLRADRQPEFTQLDMEMSFVDADDVIGMIDGLVKRTAKEVLNLDIQLPLPRMTYDEAMRRFGHDAPDLRFGMEIVDLTEIAKKTEFRVFRGAADAGNFVRGINVKGVAADFSRKKIDELTEFVQRRLWC